jgi:hypothetical protein
MTGSSEAHDRRRMALANGGHGVLNLRESQSQTFIIMIHQGIAPKIAIARLNCEAGKRMLRLL